MATTSAATANPKVFDITFGGGAPTTGLTAPFDTYVNFPVISANITTALTGALSGVVETKTQGTGREVQNLALGGTSGGLLGMTFNGPPQWDSLPENAFQALNALDVNGNPAPRPAIEPNGSTAPAQPLLGPETQRLTIQGLTTGDQFTLNILKVALPPIAYDATPANLANNIQSKLDQAFGENVFQAWGVNATQVDISPGTAMPNITTAPLIPDNAGVANFNINNSPVGLPLVGPLVSNANLPLLSGSFVSTGEVQRITLPALTNNTNFNLSFMGRANINFNTTGLDNAQQNPVPFTEDAINAFIATFGTAASSSIVASNPANDHRTIIFTFSGSLTGVDMPNAGQADGFNSKTAGVAFAGYQPDRRGRRVPSGQGGPHQRPVQHRLPDHRLGRQRYRYGDTPSPLGPANATTPSLADFTSHLLISAIGGNGPSNVFTLGPDGGPFGVAFINSLAGINVTRSSPAGRCGRSRGRCQRHQRHHQRQRPGPADADRHDQWHRNAFLQRHAGHGDDRLYRG